MIKKVKVIARKLFSSFKKMKIANLENHACQNMGAMVTASSLNMSFTNCSQLTLSSSRKVRRLCYFNIKKSY